MAPALLSNLPLTFSITVGIGAGFVMYPLIKVVKGKVGEVHPLMWVVAIAFLIYFGQDVLRAAIWLDEPDHVVEGPRISGALRNAGARGPPKAIRLQADQVNYSRWCLHR